MRLSNILTLNMTILWLVSTSIATAQTVRKLSLNELLELGVSNSLIVHGSQIDVNIAESGLADRKLSRLPELNIALVGGYSGNPTIFRQALTEPIHPRSATNWNQNYNIEILQPIYQGGRIRRSIDKAMIEQQIAELALVRDISQIKLLLIGKYLDLLSLNKQQQVIATSIAQARQRLHDILGMERNGMVTSSDVLRSQLQLSSYELSLQETRNSITIVSTDIDIALGLDQQLIIQPDSTLLDRSHEVMDYNTYLEMAYERYPELKIAQSNIEVARADTRIVQSDYLPRLSIRVANTLARPITSSSPIQDLYANTWNIGATISYNLSSLYRNRSKMAIARDQEAFQQNEREKVIQSIQSSLKASHIKYNESLDRVKTLTMSVEQANENYRIVLNKYKNQIAILTDLLDASTLQLDAQLQLTSAKSDAIYQYYQLLRASGNL